MFFKKVCKNLLITKAIKDCYKDLDSKEHSLKRVLGPTHLIVLGVGAIIGAGIFVLTGQAAAHYAGPAIVLSFIFSGIGCALAGLCYAEFASLIPISGSAYTYAYATLGEFLAWIIGWDLILEYLFGAATVAVGWSGYVNSFLKDIGIFLPSYLVNAPLAYTKEGWILTGAIINLPAVFIIALMTTLLVIGIKETANFNAFIVIIKLIVIFLFIGFGISYIKTENLIPFIPPNTGNFGEYGFSGILRGAGVVFFAYIGFDAVSTAAQEAKNPKKDMPIGILGSLLICTIIYVLVSFVLTGVVKYTELSVPDPMAVAINALGDQFYWLRYLIKLGAIAGLSSVVLVLLMGQPRIFYSMAMDGLLPKVFSKVHKRFKTPYITTIVTGIVAAFFAGLFPIAILGELVSIGTLLAFVIVCLGVLFLSSKTKEKAKFKTPFKPFIPILGAIASLAQMAALPFDTWLRLLLWMGLGFIIYFTYSIKHSRIRNK